MTVFDYTAMDLDGRRRKGMIEAENERHTRQLLRDRELTPVTVTESSSKSASLKRITQSIKFEAVSQRDLSVITRQFATMVKAGLPLAQALHALSRQNEKPAVKSMMASVRAQILEGNTLANSLAHFPRVFSELYRAGIQAGERTGHLGKVLEYLADFTESSYQARQKVLLALLYPAILTAVALAIIVFMLAHIVPDMVKVFAGAGEDLPVLTRGLIGVSDAVQQYGIFIVLLLVAGVVALRKLFQTPSIRLALDRQMLRTPLFGKLILQYASARFSSTLGMLHESGVPLVQALEIATATLGNHYLRSHMQTIARNVSEGMSMSNAMEQSGVMPPVLVTMAGSGEASGQLGEMLKSASLIQQRDLETHIAFLLGLLEPLILLVMGGVVLLLVLAVILPILNLNQLVK